MGQHVQKVLAGLRVTIPEEYCRRWKIKDGDIVIIEDTGKYLQIVPADVIPR